MIWVFLAGLLVLDTARRHSGPETTAKIIGWLMIASYLVTQLVVNFILLPLYREDLAAWLKKWVCLRCGKEFEPSSTEDHLAASPPATNHDIKMDASEAAKAMLQGTRFLEFIGKDWDKIDFAERARRYQQLAGTEVKVAGAWAGIGQILDEGTGQTYPVGTVAIPLLHQRGDLPFGVASVVFILTPVQTQEYQSLRVGSPVVVAGSLPAAEYMEAILGVSFRRNWEKNEPVFLGGFPLTSLEVYGSKEAEPEPDHQPQPPAATPQSREGSSRRRRKAEHEPQPPVTTPPVVTQSGGCLSSLVLVLLAGGWLVGRLSQ